MRKGAKIFSLVLFFALLAKANESQVPYPSFVFGHWVWEDESTTESIKELVAGYKERGIPVSAVIIDSPWETSYNSFIFDEKLYPGYKELLDELHKEGIAVILWITSAINKEDPDYNQARENNYFVKGLEEFKWWKGTGGLIDYDNPDAIKFWHQRMDRVMDLSFDGWKVDGIDSALAIKGLKRRERYAKSYYSDFYYYTKEKKAKNTIIMARGIEIFNEHTLSLPGWVNPLKLGIPLEYAPREVSFASWMGDQDPTWNGMRVAYRSFIASAKAGYLVPGSDIGGYREGKRTKELFIRWAQWGAFSPLMENGGNGEHRPWAFGDDVLEIYRDYAIFHEELGWYFFSIGLEKFEKGESLVKPLKRGYFLGDVFYVDPILTPKDKKDIRLPDGCYRDFNDLNKRYCSQEKFVKEYSLAEYPVFVKEASLIPLWVSSEFSRHKLNSSFSEQDSLWLVPGEGGGKIPLIYKSGEKAMLEWNREKSEISVIHNGQNKTLVLIIEDIKEEPKEVSLSGLSLKRLNCDDLKPGAQSAYCLKNNTLWIKIEKDKKGFHLKINLASTI